MIFVLKPFGAIGANGAIGEGFPMLEAKKIKKKNLVQTIYVSDTGNILSPTIAQNCPKSMKSLYKQYTFLVGMGKLDERSCTPPHDGPKLSQIN